VWHIVLVDVRHDRGCVSGHRINSIVIVFPLVHSAVWMTHDDILVHSVQHVFKVSHLPIALCGTIVAICEADVYRRARPQVALPCVAIA